MRCLGVRFRPADMPDAENLVLAHHRQTLGRPHEAVGHLTQADDRLRRRDARVRKTFATLEIAARRVRSSDSRRSAWALPRQTTLTRRPSCCWSQTQAASGSRSCSLSRGRRSSAVSSWFDWIPTLTDPGLRPIRFALGLDHLEQLERQRTPLGHSAVDILPRQVEAFRRNAEAAVVARSGVSGGRMDFKFRGGALHRLGSESSRRASAAGR